jgi:putative hydrolase of HD superfamily
MSGAPSPDRVEAALSVLRQADRLESFPRTGYVLSRVPQPESIAAHAYGVCLATLVLLDLIAERPDPPSPDRALALEMAILHDISEAVTTDIPAPIKVFLGRDAVREAEREAASALLAPLGPRYAPLLARYDACQCLESRVVHAADKLQLLLKVLQYEAAGLGDLRRFWEHPGNANAYGIPEAEALQARLRRYHDERDWPLGDFS